MADLNLTVDGHRKSYVALRELAETVTGGRWLALGGRRVLTWYSPVRWRRGRGRTRWRRARP